MAVSSKDLQECREWIAEHGLDHNTSPAVLLYFEDFLTGVSDLTMEERGQYITLLCLQNSKGHLTMDQIIRVIQPHPAMPEVSQQVLEKFQRDADGKYYNERMEFEIYRRVRRSKTLAANLQGKGRKEQENGWRQLSPFQANQIKRENVRIIQQESQQDAQQAVQQERQTGRLTETETEKEKETETIISKERKTPPWYRRREGGTR